MQPPQQVSKKPNGIFILAAEGTCFQQCYATGIMTSWLLYPVYPAKDGFADDAKQLAMNSMTVFFML